LNNVNEDQFRRLAVTALATDDVLYERLVLKGGNALTLVHEINKRTSLDIDYSISEDFDDFAVLSARIQAALEKRFLEAGFVVFDVRVTKEPKLNEIDNDPTWGGYRILFKAIGRKTYDKWHTDIERMRHRAVSVSPRDQKNFKVDISKYEFTDGKIETELDHYAFFAYSKEMIAAEKLRAICQQMQGYDRIANPTARARDFYDIWAISESGSDLSTVAFLDLARTIFRQKDVPIAWLRQIKDVRDFHVIDWPNVRDAISDDTEPFDYYFDFVVQLVEMLEALGIKEPPF
jgi:predicted nucleotidyltransferase component of viral defense system